MNSLLLLLSLIQKKHLINISPPLVMVIEHMLLATHHCFGHKIAEGTLELGDTEIIELVNKISV